MKRTVRQKARKRKSAAVRAEEPVVSNGGLDLSAMATRVALIQALIPIALDRVGELLAAEVAALAGPRYARADAAPARVRWGHQRGSIYLGAIKKCAWRCRGCGIGAPIARCRWRPTRRYKSRARWIRR